MSIPLEPGSLILKDPSSIEPFGFDWSAWLEEISGSETIVTSEWVVSGGPDASLAVDSDSIVTGSLQTQAILSGGTVGGRYTVTNAITTLTGYEDERSFAVRVKQR